MSEVVEGVPEDYPGRVVAFPDGVSHLIFAMIGIQSPHAAEREQFASKIVALCDTSGGPGRVERCAFIDNAGVPCEMILTYAIDREAHRSWWHSEPVQSWWASCVDKANADTGYWREILSTDKDRFNYAAGVEDKVGSAAVLPLAPSKTFGYWGSYRDRLPASKEDSFDSKFSDVPPILSQQTKGRRVSVSIPDNLCLIREGQAWGNCSPEEKTVWDEQMAAVVDEWVGFLASDPHVTGCLSVRQCNELELDGGAQPKQCQIAFLLSLGHIEHAARTHIAHLAVHKAFVKMYREPSFDPKMHVWVEVHILKKDDLDTEYVNCHEKTGLIPFFPATEL